MSTVNLVPNAVVLATHALNATFEKWKAQVNSSGFYIAVETDSTGHCFSVLASQSLEPVRDLWAYLPVEVHDPVRAILPPPSAEIKQRTLHIACHSSQHRWLECCVYYFRLDTGGHRSLLLIRETTNEHQSATVLQQEKLRAMAYERIKFSILELILKEQDAVRILEKMVHDIESLHTDVYCAIVLTKNLGKLVQTVIAPSLPQAMLHTLRQLQVEAGNGSLATAIATRQRVIIENVMTHPYWIKHREAAQVSNIQAGWSEPILSAEGEVLGAFAIYYRQPQKPSVLEQSMIEQATKLVSIVLDRHLSQESIQSLAYLELVTGLPNRRKVYEILHQLPTEPASDSHWGVVYIDLDHFKWINEAHGHAAGNSLLQQVAERLQKVVAPHFIACMGGDEFVVLLSGLAPKADKALQQVWSIQHKLQKVFDRPFKVAGQKLLMTASMGLCSFDAMSTKKTDYVKAADIAMHKAKQAGRNHACLYEQGMQTEIATQVMLETELREAIAQQQLRLYYQVQVDHTGRPFGAEVLLRWHHPQRGVISPVQFISVAESSGLIVEIGMRVLDQACAQIACWQPSPKTRELSLSVNISARQFRQANFVAMVKACIHRHQINPNALRLELTESLLLENVDDAVRIMEELSQLGIQFSLDDFGTGYSSLQYLKKLPLYQLKIDRSFVRDIVTDSHDRTIVRTIIAMAQSMYLSVIAEGVETQEQMELLLNNGCRRYQGFLFGQPMPIAPFERWLQNALV
jgi:diguanylate cyclase (GGDEF)-like protein